MVVDRCVCFSPSLTEHGASGVISRMCGDGRLCRCVPSQPPCVHHPTEGTAVSTFTPKPNDVERQWYVIDATDVVLGRLASHVAVLLRGKHKPIFANHVDTGDFVIIVNADKIHL